MQLLIKGILGMMSEVISYYIVANTQSLSPTDSIQRPAAAPTVHWRSRLHGPVRHFQRAGLGTSNRSPLQYYMVASFAGGSGPPYRSQIPGQYRERDSMFGYGSRR